MGRFFETAMPYVAALLPTIGVAFLFYYVMKYILEGCLLYTSRCV